jgi:hypothetical protein
VLKANTLHIQDYFVRETATNNSQTDNTKKIFAMKRKSRIGCWNVRTHWETGKVREATAEMKRYKTEILGISETHWTGFGEVNIQRDETFVYSGTEEGHREGVGLPL